MHQHTLNKITRLRNEGFTWGQISKKTGVTAQTCRTHFFKMNPNKKRAYAFRKDIKAGKVTKVTKDALAKTKLTLADWADRIDPDHKVPTIVNLLQETNDVLANMSTQKPAQPSQQTLLNHQYDDAMVFVNPIFKSDISPFVKVKILKLLAQEGVI
jgi:hypothetical protein